MNLTRSTGYGLMAVAYIAQHSEEAPILASVIAKEYNIPLEYLLKIMQSMVRAGILKSKRGPRGGFTMLKPANQVTMLDIVEAVNGPMRSQLEIGELTKDAAFSKKMEKVCTDAAEQARATLEKVKLSQAVK